MFTVLKSPYFVWALIILAIIGFLVSWQNNKELTKQVKEKTQQLQVAYANPKIEIKEVVKEKIIKGKTKIVEKIVYQQGTQTRMEERTIETDPNIIEIGSERENLREPVLPSIAKKEKRYTIQGTYFIDKTMMIGVTTKIWLVDVGMAIKAKDNFKDFSIGGTIGIRF